MENDLIYGVMHGLIECILDFVADNIVAIMLIIFALVLYIGSEIIIKIEDDKY